MFVEWTRKWFQPVVSPKSEIAVYEAVDEVYQQRRCIKDELAIVCVCKKSSIGVLKHLVAEATADSDNDFTHDSS